MEKREFTIDWPLVGNGQITDYLTMCIARDSVAGTYIFSGPDNLGKTTTARYFAKALLCEHRQAGGGVLPCGECLSCRHIRIGSGRDKGMEEDDPAGETHGDLHIVRKEKDKKNISIETIRGFIRALNMSSFLGTYKIGVVKHAEYLSQEAASALLKTLEEPKDGVVIVLIANNLESLPATIVSRSQILAFHPVDGDLIYEYLIGKYKASRSEAKNYSRLCLGRPALAVKFLQNREFRENYMKLHRLLASGHK
jgi:DNA polymerase-3 subunit delta'